MPGIEGALSPEEKPIIENIISLFQQLLSLQGEAAAAVETPTEEMIEMAEEEDEMDTAQAVDVEDEEIEKADGETGDSKAEERLDEQTDTTELSIAELKKTLGSLMQKAKKKVKKSSVQDNALMLEIRKMNATLRTVLKGQTDQDKLNQQLFDALGFSDEIVAKNLPVKSEQKNKPIQNTDTTAVVKDILTEVFKNIPALNQNQEYRHPFNQKREARKNLKKIATFVHNKQ